MGTSTKVVVGFEGSDESKDALSFGRLLAAAEGAELQVAVVLPRGELPFEEAFVRGGVSQQLDEQLVESARRELAGAEFTPARLDGGMTGRSAARALYEYAGDRSVSAIVVGSSHRGKAGRVLAGSVGESLLRGAPCAVAVVPRGYARDEQSVRAIGVAYDGSVEANLALAQAGRLAEAFGAGLSVITVVPMLAPLAVQAPDLERIHASLRREYGGLLDKAVSESGGAAGATPVLKEGDPAAVLVEQGAELDLLVMGSRGYGPVRSALLGAISSAVMRSAPCPVLVMPRGSGS